MDDISRVSRRTFVTLLTAPRLRELSLAFGALLEILCWYALMKAYNLFENLGNSEFAFDKVPGHFGSTTLQATYFIFAVLILLSVLKYFWVRWGDTFKPLQLVLLFLPTIFAIAVSSALFPVGGLDLFHYIFKAKMMAVYNANPYVQIASLVGPADSFFPYDPFPNHTLGYGPLWALLAKWTFRLTAAAAGPEDLLAHVYGFKFLSIVFMFGSTLILWFSVPDLRNRLLAFILFAGNPLVIFELAANAHNDSIMVFFLLASLTLLQKNRSMSLLAFTASVLIKPFAIVILPLGVVYTLVRSSRPHRDWLKAAVFSLLLLAVCWIPFLDSPDVPRGFLAGMQHANAIKTASILSLAREASNLLQLSGWITTVLVLVCYTAVLLTVVVVIYLFLHGQPVLRAAGLTYLVFCAVLTNMLPWYLVFFLAISALSIDWIDTAPAFLLSFLGLEFYLLSVWAWHDMGGASLIVHLLQAIMLTLPVLVLTGAMLIASIKSVRAHNLSIGT